jgi:hypothetical protein
MADLVDLRDKLLETHAALARLRVEFPEHTPVADQRFELTLKSLEHRREKLEASFRKAANVDLVEICDYKLIPERDGTFSISAVGDNLKHFQSWLTVVVDAVRGGPKERSRPGPDVVQQSTLDFAYTYGGSLGFVFTVPNERLLFGASDLDQAIMACLTWCGPRLLKKLRSMPAHTELARFAECMNGHTITPFMSLQRISLGNVVIKSEMKR